MVKGMTAGVRGMIFDFDGTLFDSMIIWENVCDIYLKTLGKTASPTIRDEVTRMSLDECADYLIEQYDLPLRRHDVLRGINKIVEDFYFNDAMPKSGVREFLDAARSRGIKMCIATASERYHVDAALKRCGMREYFDGIVTCCEIGIGKSRPDVFECALACLGTDKENTPVFEDAVHALKCAKSAGFYTVGVYDKYEKCESEMREVADVYIVSFDDCMLIQ